MFAKFFVVVVMALAGNSAPSKSKQEQKLVWTTVQMKLTAYCNEGSRGCRTCCGPWAKNNKTASGKTPHWGMLAADRSLLPFGTKVRIPGFKNEFVVEDTGSAIKGRRLDVFFGTANGSHGRAFKFGAPVMEVSVLVTEETARKFQKIPKFPTKKKGKK